MKARKLFLSLGELHARLLEIHHSGPGGSGSGGGGGGVNSGVSAHHRSSLVSASVSASLASLQADGGSVGGI
ncbi:hypothetical protein HK405_009620 [Cladochytrium tenue]|nr:hypothetical protein HK405_009620 [Cladochytrium tenue]